MSGTSCDGIDAALVRIDGAGPSLQAKLVAFHYAPYSNRVRERILNAPESTIAIARLNTTLAEYFADAVAAVRKLAPDLPVDAIGSHGHTIAHEPPIDGVHGTTLQIGSPAVIAERTGIPVVSDFRTRDMAVGGHGAPLVPYADAILFRDSGCDSICVNIGGIANLSVVQPDGSVSMAFDTGPGNMIIDAVVQRFADSETPYDKSGALAACGEVDEPLRNALLEHAFFEAQPPKSTGREMFGYEPYLETHAHTIAHLKPEDAVATLTEVVATSITQAIKKFALRADVPARVIVSGGGAFNPTLLDRIRGGLDGIPVMTSDELGWAADAKEAVAFALLADAHLCGEPANIPAATGGARSVILGSYTPSA